ncbi:gamma-glutamylcyclotransferase family protein [Aquipuribacter nitratireducens]|uniref:Gamma-glutamylcyclotransferase n=1 Tax=Aquipuribacter nitratireducens TaxID=650104 RepID=A0ABW0GMP8_9MICO
MTRVPHPPAVADRAVPLVLAVYGTLRRGCRNAGLLAGARHVADGHLRGALHEVSAPLGRAYGYPLLVVPGTHLVRVEAYEVGDPAALDALDALEAFDPADPAGSEYVRVLVPLFDETGHPTGLDVQTYAYAGAVEGVGALVPGGDWVRHAGDLA